MIDPEDHTIQPCLETLFLFIQTKNLLLYTLVSNNHIVLPAGLQPSKHNGRTYDSAYKVFTYNIDFVVAV